MHLNIPNTKARRSSAQSCWLFPGLQMLGCTSAGEKHGIRNGCSYVIEDIDDTIKLQGLDERLDLEQTKNYLRLAYARTYASVQGTELDGPVCLADVSHPWFTKRHMYVGLSRCREAGLVKLLR